MKTRATILTLIILLVASAAGAQMYFDSRSAHRNPALAATTSRGIFEMGVQGDATGYNSAFRLGDIFSETWVIDVNAATQRAGRTGLRLGAAAHLGTHGILRFGGIGFGGYSGLHSAAQLQVPQELLDLLADGNTEDREGQGAAVVQAHLEAGARTTVRWRDWTFGVNAAPFIPIAFSGDGGFDFSVVTTDSGFNASAGVDLAVYSSVDLAALQEGEGLDIGGAFSTAGFKVDLGAIRHDEAGDPQWGVSLTDITLVRATAVNEFRVTGSYDAGIENILDAIINRESDDPEDLFELDIEELEIILAGEARERILLAPGIAGFYRFGLPFVDIIPHAHVVFSRTLGAVNPGVTIAGNRFPTNILYFGFGRERPVWRATAGLRIPLYVMEVNLQIESTSPRVLGVFGPDGLAAAANIRLGF